MDFAYTRIVDIPFGQAIDDLKVTLKQQGMGVLWELDIPSKLQEKGQDFTTPVRILEVCNPVKAKKVLETNIVAAYFLPCKVVVFQNHEGRTALGMIRPTTLIGVLGDEGLKGIAQEVENELRAAIDGV
ncbi:MAG: DUF302 domain-containing protein [Bacillota bacterium]